MNMVGLCCLSLSCDKFILPARYEPVELCTSLSAAAILQIHSVTERSSTSSVGYMRTDMFQWLLPPPTPTTATLLPSRGPSAPALSHYVGEMFGGLSVPSCRTVRKHNASLWAPQLLRHTVCFCVRVCQCEDDLFFHRIPLLLDSFHSSLKKKKKKTRRGKEVAITVQRVSTLMHVSNVTQFPTDWCKYNTQICLDVSFQFVPIAVGTNLIQ